MAKVTGPLYSETARGSIGQTFEYSRQRGQNIVTASRPRRSPATARQAPGRELMRISIAIIRRINATNWIYAGQEQTWIEYWTDRAAPGQYWNNRMVPDLRTANRDAPIGVDDEWKDSFESERVAWNNAATTAITNLPPSVFNGVLYPPGFTLLWAEVTASENGYGPGRESFDPPIPVESAPR